MNGSKPFWASKGFWGSFAMIGTTLASALKYDIGDPVTLGLVISGFLSSGLALYGRITAVKKLE